MNNIRGLSAPLLSGADRPFCKLFLKTFDRGHATINSNNKTYDDGGSYERY